MPDSRLDTHEHIRTVESLLHLVITQLLDRALEHDKSKLAEPERSVFDEFTPRLSKVEYGSTEYKECLAQMRPALEHHYANNRHHPEYHSDGIRGMNLIDLVEMFCDWLASTMRHTDGDIRSSIEKNQSRFDYSDDLKQILLNTVDALGY